MRVRVHNLGALQATYVIRPLRAQPGSVGHEALQLFESVGLGIAARSRAIRRLSIGHDGVAHQR